MFLSFPTGFEVTAAVIAIVVVMVVVVLIVILGVFIYHRCKKKRTCPGKCDSFVVVVGTVESLWCVWGDKRPVMNC